MDMHGLKRRIDWILSMAPACVIELDKGLFYVHQPPRTACWCCGRVLAIDAVLVFEEAVYLMKKSVCMPPRIQEECPYSAEGSDMNEGTCKFKDRDDAKCKGIDDN